MIFFPCNLPRQLMKSIYEVMVNEKTTTAKAFVYFIDKLLKFRDKIIRESESEA